MLDTNINWIGQSLFQLPDTLVNEARRLGQRPTIRALFFESGHKHHQKIASYRVARVRSPGRQIFTMVGGAVHKDEGWVVALQREFREELRACHIPPSCVKNGKILAMESVPTRRLGYTAKLVVLAGIAVSPGKFHPENLNPTGREIVDLQIGSIADTAARLRNLRHTPQPMRQLYQSGLSQLRVQCS